MHLTKCINIIMSQTSSQKHASQARSKDALDKMYQHYKDHAKIEDALDKKIETTMSSTSHTYTREAPQKPC
jgi:hemerythrin